MKGLLLLLSLLPLSAETWHVVLREKASLRGVRKGQAISKLKAHASKSQKRALKIARAKGAKVRAIWADNRIIVEGDASLANELRRLPEVLTVYPDFTVFIPEPKLEEKGLPAIRDIQWGIARIGANQVWADTQGEGVLVASIDTGVDATHQILASRYAGQWHDPTGECGLIPCDGHGHGTHTLGTMVGEQGYGVAPAARFIACKGCQNAGSCQFAHLIECGQWVLDPAGDGSVLPDVVSNSWGGGGFDEYIGIIQSWRAAGVFPSFAAGNAGPNCPSMGAPGDYAVSFASGATDTTDAAAYFSSRGPSVTDGVIKPNIMAPGVGINSSLPGGKFAAWSGTSMACPHTTGAVALLIAAAPGYRRNVPAIEEMLLRTAMPLYSSATCADVPYDCPNNTYGYGLINVLKAVAVARGNAPLPPQCGYQPPTNYPPVLSILEPKSPDGSHWPNFPCPGVIPIKGSALDKEDGDISGAIHWLMDDYHHEAGNGAAISYPFPGDWGTCADAIAYEEGRHVIIADVKDSAGLRVLRTWGFYLYDPALDAPPVVTITAPGDGSAFFAPATIRFSATAIDLPDGDISRMIDWFDNGIKFDDNSATASKTYAEAGDHEIVAHSYDAGFKVSQARIKITILPPLVPPAPPSELSAQVNAGVITLEWADNSTNELGFIVDRRKGQWSELAKVTAPTYADSGVPPGKVQYRVRAYNSAGASAPSNVVTVR